MKQRGFTLIELIMVIVLVGIMAVYAGTRFDSAGYENQKIAHELIEAIRFTQAEAMNHSGSDVDGDGIFDLYTIELDNAANTYAILLESNATTIAAVADPTNAGAAYTQSWTGGVDITPSVASLTFNSRGEPVGLAGAATITINGDRTITIQPITGYVSQ